jgi:hypothetical protein
MANARNALIVTGLAFGLWEAIDIFHIDVPAFAAVFGALFLGCTAWFWRRDSVKAALGLLLLFAFETAAGPSLGAETVTKAGVIALGLAGVAASVAVLVAHRRARRAPAVAA